jgi:16S rRNA (adenine1518-N6/adenine1519-N6)-dimethyltransferase
VFSSDSLPPLRDVIYRHGLSARKSLGQHFLLDSNITAKIVRLAGELQGINVIEIGPGPGGLTRSLLHSNAHHIYAVERDDRCSAALAELQAVSDNRLTVFAEDALDFSIPDHVVAPRAIIANLPYNIGTVLLVHWLDDIARLGAGAYHSLTLMFQKEVADRLTAAPNSKQYGRLSVMVQWLCEVQPCFTLPASAFTPPPKVDSSVVQLIPRKTVLYQSDKKSLEVVLAAAFGQRRKMLRSSLTTIVPKPEAWLQEAGIISTRRAETLTIEEFCTLARLLPSHNTKTTE